MVSLPTPVAYMCVWLSQSLDISQTPLQWIGEAKTVRVQNTHLILIMYKDLPRLHSLSNLLEISSAVYKSSGHDRKR